MTYVASHSARYRRPAAKRTGLWSLISLWRSRRHLEALDDRALDDIGLTRREARSEAARPIWDVPANWRD